MGTNIGKTIKIKGEIESGVEVSVSGEISGKIKCKEGVIIEKDGKMIGDIETKNVVVHGVVEGNMVAEEKIELKSGCIVKGDLKAPRLVLLDGAKFKGSIDMGV